MGTSRVVFIALICVVFSNPKRISGVEVQMRVRRGDDVTLYSDCETKVGSNTVWFRNCSHQYQPRFVISFQKFLRHGFPRYSTEFNASTNTYDLMIKNITESDEGVYNCASQEKRISKNDGGIILSEDVYHYGNRSIQLSLLKNVSPCVPVLTHTPTPCASESFNWMLLLSVCAVSVLVSSVLSSICVYYLGTHTTKGRDKMSPGRHDEVGGDEVCYAALDIQNIKQKTNRKKRRVQDCDFSTYSEVRAESADSCRGNACEF